MTYSLHELQDMNPLEREAVALGQAAVMVRGVLTDQLKSARVIDHELHGTVESELLKRALDQLVATGEASMVMLTPANGRRQARHWRRRTPPPPTPGARQP